MPQVNHFLIELHTEELPPKSLRALSENFAAEITKRFQKAELTFSETSSFATPRRLAVLVKNLISCQQDKMIERKGPALDKAYDAHGKPTPACIGFAKSCGIEVSDLIIIETPQGKCVGSKQAVTGKTVFELIPSLIQEALSALPIPRPMRWGSYSQKFIRPVHSVILLYGDKIIEAEILGCKTNRKTRGHRFMHPDWIDISTPEKYEIALEKAFVIADFNKRKEKITAATLAVVKDKLGNNAQAIMDTDLLDEVTSLVEWPDAVCGSFDNDFLQVPQEALISAMQDHQRYFPILDQHHKLLPHFITINNIPSKEKQRIASGNERVLRARLADAAFFFNTDRKLKLSERLEKLKHIVFQNKLGTLFDKTERVQKLSVLIAKQMGEDVKTVERAALLSKCDLTTDLVIEFPELQGIAGYYYALHDKDPEAVAIALNEQYMPRFSGDALPSTSCGAALAIADRLDTLVGVFGINQPPTGEKDPFGLRRAALGVLRILIEKPYNLDLKELLPFAANHYKEKLPNANAVTDTLSFMLDRLKPWYMDQGMTANVVASVMSLNLTNPYDIHCRLQAVMAFKNLPEAESLSIANKRVSNILAKYNGEITLNSIKENLFENDSERELAKQLETQAKKVSTLSESAQYKEVLAQLANLRVPVDNFFDHVMVMTEDKDRRENRLLMLKKLRELFLHVADIALLQ